MLLSSFSRSAYYQELFSQSIELSKPKELKDLMSSMRHPLRVMGGFAVKFLLMNYESVSKHLGEDTWVQQS
jgi:hypothetical protein